MGNIFTTWQIKIKQLRFIPMISFLRLTFFLIIFISTGLYAQNTVRGTIIDAHTKEGIGYASVYFKKSGAGQTADSAGNFSFNFNRELNDTLVVSFVGYEDHKLPIHVSGIHQPVIIQMERGRLTNDVTIKAKFNKGLFLCRKIMSKKKQYNRYNLPNFSYEAYNKLEIDLKNFKSDKLIKNLLLKPFPFVLDNIDSTSEKDPFLPAYLIESISNYAYQKNPKRYFEEKVISKTLGIKKNESLNRQLGVMNQNVNIYNNFINVMDKEFISPFNDNADDYYSFSVPDTQILAGKKIFHFVFRPKRPGQNTFQGDAWVLSQTFQIQKISMFLGKDANINYIDRISVFQEYIPINDTIYFLNRDKFFADFKVLGKRSLTFIGRKTTSYRNIVINSDSLTALFKGQSIEEVIKTSSEVTDLPDSAWDKLRHDTLSTNEKAIYATIEKLMETPKFQKLQTTLRFLATGYKFIGHFEIGPWFNWVSSNAWEGTRFRFDLGTNTKFDKNIYLHGYAAYGTLDKKFKGLAEAFWITRRRPGRTRLHVSYSNDVDNGISQVGQVSQDNIFSLAIRKPGVNRKFINAKDSRFEIFHEFGKGFSGELFLSQRQYDPLLNLPLKTAFPVSKGSTLTTFDITLKLRFAYLEQFLEGDYFRYTLGTKYPVAEVLFVKAIPGFLNSAYDYSKISALIKDKIKISPYGSISYKVYGGKIYGAVPYPFLENHPGNDLYYYNTGAFNLMNRFEYLSDKYAGVNVEHNFGSGLFRFTPLTRKLKLRQFWNVKALWGSLSDANTALNNASGSFKTLQKKPYIEVGTGIDNILKILRLDLVWRIQPTPLPPNKTSRFGVFGSFQFQF